MADSITGRVFAEPAFRRLPDAGRAAVLASTVRRVYRKGGFLYRRGDEPDGLFIVLTGLVRVTGLSRDGDEFILDLCGPGFWIGEIGVFEGRTRTHDAIAEERSEVLHLAGADVERLLSEQAAFARALLHLAAKRFRQAVDWANQCATAPLAARLAFRLLLLAGRDERFDDPGRIVELAITQTTLSRLVGATRQRVSQQLQAWEAAGLIGASRGTVSIIKPDALARIFESL